MVHQMDRSGNNPSTHLIHEELAVLLQPPTLAHQESSNRKGPHTLLFTLKESVLGKLKLNL